MTFRASDDILRGVETATPDSTKGLASTKRIERIRPDQLKNTDSLAAIVAIEVARR